MSNRILTSLALFGSKRKAGNRTGIIKVFRRSVSDKHFSLRERILKATSDIFFMGLSLSKLDKYASLLEEKARSGVNIRLLVPDSHEKWLIEAIANLVEREGDYPRELSGFFTTFYAVWNNCRETILVHVYSRIPTLSAMMFDGEEGNVEIYMFGWKTENRIMMELEYSKSAKDMKNNLNRIWNDAIPLQFPEHFTRRIDAANAIAQEIILTRK